MLLAGSDLIHTMSEPGVWSTSDVSRPSTRIRTPETSGFRLLLCSDLPRAANTSSQTRDDEIDQHVSHTARTHSGAVRCRNR